MAGFLQKRGRASGRNVVKGRGAGAQGNHELAAAAVAASEAIIRECIEMLTRSTKTFILFRLRVGSVSQTMMY
jgi:hypothetical protein